MTRNQIHAASNAPAASNMLMVHLPMILSHKSDDHAPSRVSRPNLAEKVGL